MTGWLRDASRLMKSRGTAFALGWFAAVAGASAADITAGLVLDPPPFLQPATPRSPSDAIDAALPGPSFRHGIGLGWLASGRFGGRGHSDGVLDWDCLEFGLIEKGYLAAHPQNTSHRRWTVRLSPPGLTRTTADAAQDDFRINWMSVTWKSRFVPLSTNPAHRTDEGVEIRTTYSLATPGMLIETSEKALRFDLAETPGYRFAVLPLRGGPTVRAFAPDEPVYDRKRDGDLSDNWILLWGSLAFPDVPLLLVPREQPARIVPIFDSGAAQISALVVEWAGPMGYVTVATPYGMQALSPVDTARDEQLRDGIEDYEYLWLLKQQIERV